MVFDISLQYLHFKQSNWLHKIVWIIEIHIFFAKTKQPLLLHIILYKQIILEQNLKNNARAHAAD